MIAITSSDGPGLMGVWFRRFTRPADNTTLPQWPTGDDQLAYHAVCPPSTAIIALWTNDAESVARNRITSATSSDRPSRPIACRTRGWAMRLWHNRAG
jgi:hypothetical protein